MVEVVVGRIGRPHGIKGEVSIEVRTDDPEGRFPVGATLRTDPASSGPLTIVDGKVHSGRLLLTFEGVTDRSAAERLRNTLLLADVTEGERLDDPDEFYDAALVGLLVRTVEGDVVGTVREMVHLPAQDLIAVARDGGGEVLVPFVAELVPTVDLEAGEIVIDPPLGLLEDLPEEDGHDGEGADGEASVGGAES